MRILETELSGVILVEPQVFEDHRGFFMEAYHKSRFAECGIVDEFVQDNHSRSCGTTLRGLHYQIRHSQAKLVRVLQGEIWDVAVDLRRSSPDFGRHVGVSLSAENRRQLYIPRGFAHGFCVISDTAEVLYKCSDFYYPEFERTLLWNDRQLAIPWPIDEPILSQKDAAGTTFAEAECFE
jgi:dTDP-4-dehydrorhamnose 3,5-epimerase